MRKAAASADAEDFIASPPRWLWLSALVAIIAGMAMVPLLVASCRPAPTPKRRTANTVSTRVAAHPKMLDASLTTPDDPGLSGHDAEKGLSSINVAMHEADITTPDQQAAFLAQIAQDSDGLRMVNELPSGLLRSQWNDEQAVRDYFNNYANINGNGDVSSGDASLTTPDDPGLGGYDADKWLWSINMAMHEADITTPDQQAAFLAQIAEESSGLRMVNELPWGLLRSQWNDEQAVRDYFNNKYANMNGNGDVSSGDGYNYRGRGILQITGKSNYAAVSEKLYGDDRLVQNPDLLSQPDAACAAAAAYWDENNLNRFIPPGQPVTPQQFQDLGSTINVGHPGDVPNNAAERAKDWEVAKEALGVTRPVFA